MRMMSWKLAVAAGLLSLGGLAQATLIDRGNGLIYDDVLNITWLQDANLAASNTFGVGGINANGTMTWNTAEAWIAAMNAYNGGVGYLGYDDWRLPTMVDTGTSGCNFAYSGTDCGYNVQTGSAATTVYSEMASLFYDTLGNLAYYDTSGSGPQSGWGLTNTGPFSNVRPNVYWSGLEYAPDSSGAWLFSFNDGVQSAGDKHDELYAWAVRPGDVAAAPEPATGLLMALGLMGLGAVRRVRRAT